MEPGRGLAIGVIDIDDEGDGFEDLLHFLRHGEPGGLIRPVDLGEQSGEHRRPGRHLHHLEHAARGQGERLEPAAEIERDGVAGAPALGLGREHEVQPAEPGRLPRVIVTDQAVEVEGFGRAGIELERAELGQRLGDARRGEELALGILEARPGGEVDEHAHLRLVVEGQQLHRHVLGIEEEADGDGGRTDQEEEDEGAALGGEHRPGDGAVEPPQSPLAMAMGMGLGRRGAQGMGVFALRRELHHQPRRDDHGDEEGEQHRRRGIGRDGRHVGPHQAGDEEHRQKRGDHGEGSDHGRVADLGHRLDRRLDARPAVPHRPVPRDVLHHHDRVIDQDADGEDEGEERDAVDGVAHHLRGEEGEQDGGGDDDEGDEPLPPADGKGDEDDDGDGGDAEMEEELVRLLVRRLAIVAGDLDVDVGRDQRALETLHPIDDVIGDHHRVRAGALGERQRNGGPLPPLALGVALDLKDVVLDEPAAHHHLGHVAHIDRAAIAGGEQKEPDIGDAGERLARLDLGHLASLAHHPRHEGAVGIAHPGDELLQGHAEEGEFLRIGLDADLFRIVAGDIGEADILGLDELGLQLAGQPREISLLPARRRCLFGRESEDDDGDVIDAAADDERGRDPDRDPVHVGADLVIDPEHRVVLAGADHEARGDPGLVVHRLAIDVLHAGDRLDDGLERLGDELDHVRRLEPVGLDDDIDHGDVDLRVLLARDGEQRDEAGGERGKQEEGRDRRADRRLGQPSGNAEIHGVTSTSPGAMPERTSTPSGISGVGKSRPRWMGMASTWPSALLR